MQCEMCGQNVPFTKKVKVEGTLMDVCPRCARFGDEAKQKPSEPSVPKIVSQRLERRDRRVGYRDVFEDQKVEEVLVDDYPRRIVQARNAKRLTKKELATRLNEKLSVIHSLERGELHPDDRLILKLEKELGIRLKEKLTETPVNKRAYSQGITLGDLIKLE